MKNKTIMNTEPQAEINTVLVAVTPDSNLSTDGTALDGVSGLRGSGIGATYGDKKVMIGLSGGINSMAVLCWLANQKEKPKELHLFYAHFEEHSEGTLEFVLAGVEYAQKHFEKVIYKQTNNSVIEFFKSLKMIPHPTIAPCTRMLKIIPMANYAMENGIQVDLIGYVKTEKRRARNMEANGAQTLFLSKEFPILSEDNEWCFDVVRKEIGFYPAIYDIRDANGKRVFTHNNCIPCKNWNKKNFASANQYYPDKMKPAIQLQQELKKHWGREELDIYTRFDKEDWETNEAGQTCEHCAFD